MIADIATLQKFNVSNRGRSSVSFLIELVTWARNADDSIFAVNAIRDIYSKVKEELGPFTSLNHRKAVMLEVMRVLAGFESGWDWTEGVDTSRLGADTPANSEAGAWQVSYNARNLSLELVRLTQDNMIFNGVDFQQVTKFNRHFAMEFVARLMRVNTKHNGPLYKGDERLAIRKSLRGAVNSIYPWLRREAVAEFEKAILSKDPL